MYLSTILFVDDLLLCGSTSKRVEYIKCILIKIYLKDQGVVRNHSDIMMGK